METKLYLFLRKSVSNQIDLRLVQWQASLILRLTVPIRCCVKYSFSNLSMPVVGSWYRDNLLRPIFFYPSTVPIGISRSSSVRFGPRIALDQSIQLHFPSFDNIKQLPVSFLTVVSVATL